MQSRRAFIGILAAAADVPVRLRVALVVRGVGLTFAEIERRRGLTRGTISAYVGGRQYAYPKLRKALVAEVAAAAGEDPDAVRGCLFPLEALQSAQPGANRAASASTPAKSRSDAQPT